MTKWNHRSASFYVHLWKKKSRATFIDKLPVRLWKDLLSFSLWYPSACLIHTSHSNCELAFVMPRNSMKYIVCCADVQLTVLILSTSKDIEPRGAENVVASQCKKCMVHVDSCSVYVARQTMKSLQYLRVKFNEKMTIRWSLVNYW